MSTDHLQYRPVCQVPFGLLNSNVPGLQHNVSPLQYDSKLKNSTGTARGVAYTIVIQHNG